MSSKEKKINKGILDQLFFEVAKDYQKRTHRHGKGEIVVLGGAAIIAYYSFRAVSCDVDAVIDADSEIFESIRSVGERFNLDPTWLNDAFKQTESYSPKLVQYSMLYRTFCHCLSVRFVTGSYLVATKLKSFRPYRDMSDIAGIIFESKRQGQPLTNESIHQAYRNLYGEEIVTLDPVIERFLQEVFAAKNVNGYYQSLVEQEAVNRETLVEIDKTESLKLHQMTNLEILQKIKEKQGKK